MAAMKEPRYRDHLYDIIDANQYNRKTPSAFKDAFDEYIRSLPEKKSKWSILARIDLKNPPTLEDIQESLHQIEAKHAQKPSVKIMKRVLGRTYLPRSVFPSSGQIEFSRLVSALSPADLF